MHFSTFCSVASASVCYTESNFFLLDCLFLSFVSRNNSFKVTKLFWNISSTNVSYPPRGGQICPLETAEMRPNFSLATNFSPFSLKYLSWWLNLESQALSRGWGERGECPVHLQGRAYVHFDLSPYSSYILYWTSPSALFKNRTPFLMSPFNFTPSNPPVLLLAKRSNPSRGCPYTSIYANSLSSLWVSWKHNSLLYESLLPPTWRKVLEVHFSHLPGILSYLWHFRDYIVIWDIRHNFLSVEWRSSTFSAFFVVQIPWSQRLSLILSWQILWREPLLLFFIDKKHWETRKESLWSRPLGVSLSCHQLLTVVSDWRIFFIALRVIWLDGLNIVGDVIGQKKMTSLTAVKSWASM